MPKCLTILFCTALLVPRLQAQQEFVTTHSFSKQFVIYGPKITPIKRSQRIPLDTALLASSCERIKQTVLAELGCSVGWQSSTGSRDVGKIYVVLHPGTRQPVLITPINNTATLSYRIELPNEIEASHLIEAITQATLLELVNRKSTENFTQIPLWLAQGMAAQVQSAAPDTLILERNQPVSISKVRIDPTVKIRQAFQNSEPLTFADLSWPEHISREKNQAFDACAHLFVHELLRLKNGGDCMRRFLDELPNHRNWQVAFLFGFEPHFKHLVEVEKWWDLRLVNLTGRDASQLWSLDQSLERIETAVHVSVQIRSTNSLPTPTAMTLQEVISSWDNKQQEQALTRVANQLQVLRQRVKPELIRIVDDYLSTLDNYLHHEKNLGIFRRVLTRNNPVELKESTQARLNVLDQQRLALKKPKSPTREEAMRSALEVSEGQKLSLKK